MYLVRSLLESKYMVFAGQYSPDQAALEALKAQYPDSLRLVPLDIGSAGSVKEAAREYCRKYRAP
ncbi:hypothetical protein ACFSQ7_47995 [Paenibacillus rhizoplanae]